MSPPIFFFARITTIIVDKNKGGMSMVALLAIMAIIIGFIAVHYGMVAIIAGVTALAGILIGKAKNG